MDPYVALATAGLELAKEFVVMRREFVAALPEPKRTEFVTANANLELRWLDFLGMLASFVKPKA
jgi:hypothetical protein